ncbi:DUF1843 domain-containing protein [Niveispirillum sp. SYP-B3756]|uniref:DUF1843 domain-containing protein n=1 Tax=Niveispirillum sp. SYP-B3756 TaxID=2662178 RepID=UPI001291916A|nr:DUF1843 domain-containing protein [Niveispirillum sp. SYP-B3756]MQP67447.1 DUF1843 domain-containing protein [Niveispirillum sp. SYP-B3756]
MENFTAITPYGVAIRTAIASGNLDALKVALSLAQELHARDGDVRSALAAARAQLAASKAAS